MSATEVIQMNAEQVDLVHVSAIQDSNEFEDAGDPTEAVLAPSVPDDPIRKRNLITNINQWKMSRLGRHLGAVNTSGLEQMSVAELEGIQAQILSIIQGNNSGASTEFVFNIGTSVIENAAKVFTPQIKLNGLSQACSQNEAILDTIAEISLSYQFLSNVDPVKRLGLQVAGVALQLHQVNSYIEQQQKIAESLKKEITKDLIDKADGL